MKVKQASLELLNIKTDYVFKRIFGHVGNEEITKDFLSSILKEKVSKIELIVSIIEVVKLEFSNTSPPN